MAYWRNGKSKTVEIFPILTFSPSTFQYANIPVISGMPKPVVFFVALVMSP